MVVRKKTMSVDDSVIARLATEAANAGDREMVKICGKALLGNAKARKECARVVYAARAMDDSSKAVSVYDYKTGALLRPATAAEEAASKRAADRDGGSGVIKVDGRSVFVS